MKKAFLLLSTATLLFAACSKNTGVVPREALIPGKWRTNSFKITLSTPGKPYQLNLLDTLYDCQRDDLTEFTTDHDVYWEAGPLQCDSADSTRTYVGTWKLMNSEKDLYLSTSTWGDVIFKINEVTTDNLHLSKDTIVSYNGINFTGTADLIFRK